MVSATLEQKQIDKFNEAAEEHLRDLDEARRDERLKNDLQEKTL